MALLMDDEGPKTYSVGMFGAPACRCTNTLLALVCCMAGIIMVGVGGVMCGFMWHETLAQASGLILVILGVLVLVAGSFLFAYEHFKHKKSRASQYSYGPASNTTASDPLHPPLGRPSGRVAATSSSQAAASTRCTDAPPSYDTVVTDSGREPKGGNKETAGRSPQRQPQPQQQPQRQPQSTNRPGSADAGAAGGKPVSRPVQPVQRQPVQAQAPRAPRPQGGGNSVSTTAV